MRSNYCRRVFQLVVTYSECSLYLIRNDYLVVLDEANWKFIINYLYGAVC